MSFRDDFAWGAATASYQIEGTRLAEGRKPCVWDMFCQKPSATYLGHDGSSGPEHIANMKQDVVLMKQLGINAYRFSISWPWVFPDGTGQPNEAALDFYDRLVDELEDAGIAPWVTLFHWDLPLELYRRGGWLNREIVDWFSYYAAVVAFRLSDRVFNWLTLNEPQCFILAGMQAGVHAPGDKLQTGQVATAAHNALLAHGKAVQAIRGHALRPGKVGIVPVGTASYPHTSSPQDIEAAKHWFLNPQGESMAPTMFWTDPVFGKGYPEAIINALGANAPQIKQGDMELIAQPLDLCAYNCYNGVCIKAGENGRPVEVPQPMGNPITSMQWPITPEVLYYTSKWLNERYGKPVVVTENGMGNFDVVHMDGQVHDSQRIDFLHRYLRELKRAADDGVDVAGYFLWSLLDNFEWAEGYKQRFGIIHVDYDTKQRIPKDSYWWYRDRIASNGEDL